MKNTHLLWLLPLTLSAHLKAEETHHASDNTDVDANSYEQKQQEITDQNKVNNLQLSPMTVTAGATLADELSSPKSVSIYTRQDIQKSGVTMLMDFFKYYTEIQTDPSSGNILNPKISMRGFGNGDGYQNINVIVDGVTLNQIDSVSQQLSSIPVTSIEKIEVVKSDGAVVYGDNSAAGTIIIRTNNNFDRTPLYGSLRTSFGTYDTTLTHVNLGSITDFKGLKILADGKFSYLNSDGKKPALKDGGYDSTENINGKATLGFQKNNFEIITSFIKDDSNVVFTGNQPVPIFEQNPNAAVINGSRNIVHKEDWSTALKYKFNGHFNVAYTYANKTRDSKFPDFNFAPHYEGEDHRLTLQALYDDFTILSGFEHNANNRRTTEEVTAKENIAGFISADYFVNDRLTVNAGFRQAFIEFTHDDSQTDTHLAKSISPNSYNLAANYSLSANDAVFANYVHAFQSPDIDRFFVRQFRPNQPPLTTFNFAINPAEINTYSIGYKHMEEDLKIKAEFYYSDLNNEIYLDTGPFINTNFDNSEKMGVDLFLYKDFGWLHGSINYQFTATRAKLGDNHVEISGQPDHIVLATIGSDFTNSLLPLPYHSVSLTHKYQSESYAQDDFNNFFGRQQPYNATTFNYQLSDNKHWTIDFSILNLFDVENGQFVRGFTGVVAYPTNYQRTFQGSINYQF